MSGEISGAGAAHFGLMLTAVRDHDLCQVAEMLVSISQADIDAIRARLAEFGIDARDLVATLAAEGAAR